MTRYIVLLGSLLVQICLGGVYAWSAFTPPLMQSHGLTAGQAAMVFGVAIATFTITMVFGGRWQESSGPRLVAACGAVLFGGGYLVASLSGGRYGILLAGVGLLAGAGTGLAYVCPLATCVKWFPDRKGLITGVAVAGFGGGAMLLSQIIAALLARGLDVLEIFRVVGMTYGPVILTGALLLSVPARRASAQPALRRKLPANLLSRPFAGVVLGMFAGTFGGLLVIGNLKPLGLAGGISSDHANTAVGIFAAGNALGRIAWGILYDRIGHIAIPASLLTLLTALFGLLAVGSPAVFLCASALAGFGFGACFVLYAAHVATLYGHDRLGVIYPLVFLAYGFSGLTGPAAGGWIYDVTGSYAPAVLSASALILAGAVVTWLLERGRLPRAQLQPEPGLAATSESARD